MKKSEKKKKEGKILIIRLTNGSKAEEKNCMARESQKGNGQRRNKQQTAHITKKNEGEGERGRVKPGKHGLQLKNGNGLWKTLRRRSDIYNIMKN